MSRKSFSESNSLIMRTPRILPVNFPLKCQTCGETRHASFVNPLGSRPIGKASAEKFNETHSMPL